VSDGSMMVFTGSANPQLARSVVNYLSLPMGRANVGKFSDGEVAVEIMENVRGRDIFVVQPTCTPTNDNLIELLVMIDALRRASAYRITAVIPYFGYSRQDRRPRSARVPLTARLVADMITTAGADRVLTVDLHADQVQGFFNKPVDNIYASPILLGDIWRQEYPELMVVSPDVGGVVRARALAKRLDDADLAVDDLVDTAGTLCKAAQALKDNGAARVMAYCTHPVLSGPAVENIETSVLDALVVTDTIPLTPEAQACRAAGRDHAPGQQRGVSQLAVYGLTVLFAGLDSPVIIRAPGRKGRGFLSLLIGARQ